MFAIVKLILKKDRITKVYLSSSDLHLVKVTQLGCRFHNSEINLLSGGENMDVNTATTVLNNSQLYLTGHINE
jgi:hypothetical protein